MYLLARFFRKPERMKQFMSGKIHFSNINEFRKVGWGLSFEDIMAGKGPNQAQMDILEGSVAEIDMDYINDQFRLKTKASQTLPIALFNDQDMRDLIVANPRVIAEGYNYANMLCMSKIEYTRPLINGVLAYDFAFPDMRDFGDYVVLIYNQQVFVDRLIQAADKKGFKILCRDVTYHKLKYGSKIVREMTSGTMISQESFQITDFMNGSYAEHIACDSFDKWENYKDQKEWRVTLDSRIDMKAETLDIGDVSTIAIGCQVSDIKNRLQRISNRGNIRHMSGFMGNISREDLRDRFYAKGNGMAHIAFMVGAAKYEGE